MLVSTDFGKSLSFEHDSWMITHPGTAIIYQILWPQHFHFLWLQLIFWLGLELLGYHSSRVKYSGILISWFSDKPKEYHQAIQFIQASEISVRASTNSNDNADGDCTPQNLSTEAQSKSCSFQHAAPLYIDNEPGPSTSWLSALRAPWEWSQQEKTLFCRSDWLSSEKGGGQVIKIKMIETNGSLILKTKEKSKRPHVDEESSDEVDCLGLVSMRP